MNPGNLLATARQWFWPLLVVVWLWSPTTAARFVDDVGWALRDLLDQVLGTVL